MRIRPRKIETERIGEREKGRLTETKRERERERERERDIGTQREA